jgi:hypothetical protein
LAVAESPAVEDANPCWRLHPGTDGHRPHRSLAHATPVPSDRAEARNAPNLGRLRRRDVLGGLIHEYEYAA